jgi:tRNA dimethylallyltransferase
MKKTILIVCGPTATGKTDFAVNLAKKVDGELISADSRQIYTHLNITNNLGAIESTGKSQKIKLTKNLSNYDYINLPGHHINGIPIHLVNFLFPDHTFDVFSWKYLCELKIQEIIEKGKVPIIVGGTGLYIDSIIKNYKLQITNLGGRMQEPAVRKSLNKLSLNELQERLSVLNFNIFQSLNNSDKNNKRRLIRLIEKQSDSLQPIVDKSETLDTKHDMLDFKMFYPKFEWEDLKPKLVERVERMFSAGIIEEVQVLLDINLSKNSPGLKTMGASQVVDYLEGKLSLAECKEKIILAHRKYAKRQRTWFEGKGRNYELEIVSFK